jgi:hypothetical protein
MLVISSVLFTVWQATYAAGNSTSIIVTALTALGVYTAISVPILLISCILVARFTDANFGTLSTALLKLTALSLAPIAVAGLLFTLIGDIEGLVIGAGAAMASVYVLLGVLFGLEWFKIRVFMAVSLVVQIVSYLVVKTMLG